MSQSSVSVCRYTTGGTVSLIASMLITSEFVYDSKKLSRESSAISTVGSLRYA